MKLTSRREKVNDDKSKKVNMTRTFFDRRVACKQIMRLAHVFLHIAAHILPILTSKERASHLTTMHTGIKHQTRSHPGANFYLSNSHV